MDQEKNTIPGELSNNTDTPTHNESIRERLQRSGNRIREIVSEVAAMEKKFRRNPTNGGPKKQ